MSTKRIVSAEDILKAEDIRFVDVDVSPWVGEGAHVRLMSLSAEEAFKFIEDIGKQAGMVQIVVKSAVDENGKRLFTDEQGDALRKKAFGMFARIQDAAMKLNGLRKEDEEEGAKEKIKNG